MRKELLSMSLSLKPTLGNLLMMVLSKAKLGGLLLGQDSALHTLALWSTIPGASLSPGGNTGVHHGFGSEQVTPVHCSLHQVRVSNSL